MTSASSRRSFYPLPPSQYPQPLVQPCAALETTYAHNHCAHSVRDAEFFRSRTLHPHSSPAQQAAESSPLTTAPSQGIYPRHGIGQFVAPYYRRDSKGYRRPYTQPPAVDEQYSATRDLSGLAQSGFQWSHPSSRPGYAASKSSAAAAGGAVFGTTYRNSGLYDASMAYTSRPARLVADALQQARINGATTTSLAATQPLSASFSASSPGRAQVSSPSAAAAGATRTAFASSYASLGPSMTGRASQQQPSSGMEGYYTGEVADEPPPGAEILTEDDDQQSAAAQYQQQQQFGSPSGRLGGSGGVATSKVFEDPLLPDPLDNAIRKPRTVYQRAYGRCH